jgi:hypothetical protein
MQKTLFAFLFTVACAVPLQAKAGAQSLSNNLVMAPQDVVIGPERPDRDEVIAFWTEERLKEAWNTVGPDSWPEEPPLASDADDWGYTVVEGPYFSGIAKMTGILVYENLEDGEREPRLTHCSASVLQSGSQSLILTAAYCFRNGGSPGLWHKHLMFVPRYLEKKDGSLTFP